FVIVLCFFFFFFSSRRRHTRFSRDWSSDVCSSDLLPFRDAAFDKVFTVNTLYFWEEPELQLSEIRRVLRPTGIFCLAIASKAFMETLPFSRYGFRLYSPEEASQLLANNGFTIAQRAIGHYGTTGQSGAVLREEITILARIN